MKLGRGFSLIELMMAVAVVGILASIAYPSYLKQIVKSRRALAQTALANGQLSMERFFSEKSTYLGAAGAAPTGKSAPCISASPANTGAAPCIFATSSASSYYDFAICGTGSTVCGSPDPTSTSYTLRAKPKTGTPQATDGYLEITQSGEKHWDKNNNGAIADSEKTW